MRIFVFILMALLLVAEAAFADTQVSGQILVDTTWTLDKSPYVVTGKIQVGPAATLTINPGVVVNVSGVGYQSNMISVFGKVKVAGSKESKTILNNVYLTNEEAWDTDNGTLEIDYCIYNSGEIEFSGFGHGYIEVIYPRQSRGLERQ